MSSCTADHPAGDRVLLLVGSANRDERVFPDADIYDLDRDTSKLVSFGSGRHFCMGAALARLEARISLEELVSRVADYDIDADAIARVHSSTCAASPPCPPRSTPLTMARFEPHPERRPAIVTGASSGIGAAIAVALAAAGFPVALGARRAERCEEIAQTIRDGGGEATAHFARPRRATTIDPVRGGRNRALGAIEVLVRMRRTDRPRCGAVHHRQRASTSTVQVNLLGTLQLVTTVTSTMVERRRGDVVFVTSDAVRHPRPMMAAYSATKWALEGYARTLQMELEGTGVRAIDRPARVPPAPRWAWTGATT